MPQPHEDPSTGRSVRAAVVRLATARATAVLPLVICLGGLVYAALPVRGMQLGMPLVTALPANTQEHQAQQAAATGFAAGVVAPTLVVVQGDGVVTRPETLTALEDLLKREPHVAGVIGPEEGQRCRPSWAGRPDLFVAPQHATAQFVVVLDEEPLDAAAVQAVEALRSPGCPPCWPAPGCPRRRQLWAETRRRSARSSTAPSSDMVKSCSPRSG